MTFEEFILEHKDSRIPVTIRNHPGVEEALWGPNYGSDYKFDVALKDGWIFTAGRMAGTRSGFFNSVSEFRYSEPKQAKDI